MIEVFNEKVPKPTKKSANAIVTEFKNTFFNFCIFGTIAILTVFNTAPPIDKIFHENPLSFDRAMMIETILFGLYAAVLSSKYSLKSDAVVKITATIKASAFWVYVATVFLNFSGHPLNACNWDPGKVASLDTNFGLQYIKSIFIYVANSGTETAGSLLLAALVSGAYICSRSLVDNSRLGKAQKIEAENAIRNIRIAKHFANAAYAMYRPRKAQYKDQTIHLNSLPYFYWSQKLKDNSKIGNLSSPCWLTSPGVILIGTIAWNVITVFSSVWAVKDIPSSLRYVLNSPISYCVLWGGSVYTLVLTFHYLPKFVSTLTCNINVNIIEPFIFKMAGFLMTGFLILAFLVRVEGGLRGGENIVNNGNGVFGLVGAGWFLGVAILIFGILRLYFVWHMPLDSISKTRKAIENARQGTPSSRRCSSIISSTNLCFDKKCMVSEQEVLGPSSRKKYNFEDLAYISPWLSCNYRGFVAKKFQRDLVERVGYEINKAEVRELKWVKEQ